VIAFIGLGNVGLHYSHTKHNFGFWVVDELVRRRNLAFCPGKGGYVFAENTSDDILWVKPTSGMNTSGIPVKDVWDRWQIDLADLHMIVDDVDLPLGTLRIRPRGGDGCHRGLESVIYHLKSTDFPRIRMGIGTSENMRPSENYVLKQFRKQDRPLAEEMVKRGADAAESILLNGLGKTMSEFNRLEIEEVTE
jgi:PTH1 family peptidyl-tRNA hydrolase|tara:strand:+ start:16172 stop:16750 length:579 start_codon:yes stop_codon:yes gene_type:complete